MTDITVHKSGLQVITILWRATAHKFEGDCNCMSARGQVRNATNYAIIVKQVANKNHTLTLHTFKVFFLTATHNYQFMA